MKLKSLSLVAAVAGASFANAQFATEFIWNPASTDSGYESIEIQGTPGATLNNLYIISIEGDGGVAGVIDQKIALPAITLGSNGLALIRQVTSSGGSLAPYNALVVVDPATTVVSQFWTPDIENGTNTFAVVQAASPFWTGLTTVDADLDGTIDSGVDTTMTSLGAISVTDNGSADKMYAAQLNGTNFVFNGTTPGAAYRVLDAAGTAPLNWVVGGLSNQNGGTNAGPYLFFGEDFSLISPALTLTELPGLNPGAKNLAWPSSAVATISGNLVLENTADDGLAGTETITWTLSNGVNSYTSDFTVDDFGGGAYSFDIPAAAANGDYTLSFDGGTFLKSTFNVTLSGSSLTQAVSLRNGDIDNDAEVGPSDFEAVVGQFGGPGDADVDNDGEVGPSDFEIVIANFGLGDN